MIRKSIRKKAALVMAVIMFTEVTWPTVAWALTSGPKQPEFANFTPVAITQMVNEFTGDFTYNVPLGDVDGYPVNLAYHSGSSIESEASWVGFGMSLTVGSIDVNTYGYADDLNGETITKFNKAPNNWTASVSQTINAEAFSFGIQGGSGVTYNSYRGFGASFVGGLSALNGAVSTGFNYADGETNFSLDINPRAIVQQISDVVSLATKTNPIPTGCAISPTSVNLLGGNYGLVSYSDAVRATNVVEYTGGMFRMNLNVLATPSPIPAGIGVGIEGSYTWQDYTDELSLPAYGYMYSANSKDKSLMDYHVERETDYNPEAFVLGMPYNNADVFNVAYEGLSGGFRLYHSKPGHFKPVEVSNEMLMGSLGFGAEVGMNNGGGLNLSFGAQNQYMGDWTDKGNTDQYVFPKKNETDEHVFLRFFNDMGGNVNYSNSDQSLRAKIMSGSPHIQTGELYEQLNNGQRAGRSSAIFFNKNEDMSTSYRRYTLDPAVDAHVSRSEPGMEKRIAEFAIVNEDGSTTIFGLPVYARNVEKVSYGPSFTSVDNNYLAYGDISNMDVKVGEKVNTAYATTYLPTLTTSSDYLDVTGDGPTPDDLGWYAKFNYARQLGAAQQKLSSSSAHWSKFRIPYKGLLYNRNDFSNADDDLGYVMYGEKETYRLESIETSRAQAFFVTNDTDKMLPNGMHLKGSGVDRVDAQSAIDNQAAAKGHNGTTAKAFALERIEFYAKDEDGYPAEKLKTVHFKYDNSLCRGLPNANGEGKLTLKEIWFDNGSVIDPYYYPIRFEYSYPDKSLFPQEKQHLFYSNTLNENPNFSHFNIDAWGNYQANGAERFRKGQRWVDQTPDEIYDPAAYQLKQIHLPSGGTILIQYEADDYAYVQNRPAHGLTNLTNHDGNKYYINTYDIGVTSDEEKNELVRLMRKEFLEEDYRAYFKFFYTLMPGEVATVTSDNCNGEYVRLYGKVEDVGIENGNVYITLAEIDAMPDALCREDLKKNRTGHINPTGDCNPNNGMTDGKPEDVIMSLFAHTAATFDFNLTCNKISHEDSYVKLPLVERKIGGGIRVKRLMMTDQGPDGETVIYGNEYIYKMVDDRGKVISSGVATNEPGSCREENPLVFPLRKYEKTYSDKHIGGKILEFTEGPIGESILPAPSVGYRHLVITNIHDGKTSPGFRVTQHYTAFEYPYNKHYSHLNAYGASFTSIEEETDFFIYPIWPMDAAINHRWVSQGSQFIQTNMHGQLRSASTYAGEYVNLFDIEKNLLTAQQVITYKEPGQGVNVLLDLNEYDLATLGREEDITMERRSVRESYMGPSLQFDISVGINGPVPLPFASIFGSYFTLKSTLYEGWTSSKIVRYPAIVASVETTNNGITDVVENIAFDKATGRPVVTQSYSGYNGLILGQSTQPHDGRYRSTTIPASIIYKGMGQKASNQGKIIKSDAQVSMKHTMFGNQRYLQLSDANGKAVCNEEIEGLGEGDKIAVFSSSSQVPEAIYHSGPADFQGIPLFKVPQMPFNNSTFDVHRIEIIRSGKNNILTAAAASYLTYGQPNSVNKPSPVTPAEILARKAFAQALTEALNNNTVLYEVEDNYPVVRQADGTIWPDHTSVMAMFGTGYVLLVTNNGSSDNCRIYMPADGKNMGAYFDINENGELVFFRSDKTCHSAPTGCIGFEDYTPPSALATLDGVIRASATTYSDIWNFDHDLFGIPDLENEYATGERGLWMPKATYVFRGDVVRGSNGNGPERIYNGGIIKPGTFKLYDFKNSANNNSAEWMLESHITKRNPFNHNPIEEKDMTNQYSVAKYAYHNAVPSIIATGQNLTYDNVRFESFEREYTKVNGNIQWQEWEDGLMVHPHKRTDQTAHSGKFSLPIGLHNGLIYELSLNEFEGGVPMIVKLWIKENNPNAAWVESGEHHPWVKVTAGTTHNLTKVAQSGEWALYETSLLYSGNFIPKIHAYPGSVFIDDVRMQPQNSVATAYVYDTSLRLVTVFDDQHFGEHYIYNQAGELIRKERETERGKIPLTEAYHNVPPTPRN